MTPFNTSLPDSNKLDIAALSRIFKNTTNSYKYLFFLAILETLQQKPWDKEQPVVIPIQDLTVEMALLSWYPIQFYKLSFGPQDQVAKIISKLSFDPSFKAITSSEGRGQLRTAIQEQSKAIGLRQFERYVPYLLQSVFFKEELKGVKSDTQKNQIIEEQSAKYNSLKNPLYSYVSHNNLRAIKLNPEWLRYLLQAGNITIIRDWALLGWVNYLQKRNPNTPAIINKVLPPIKRASLNTQTNFWKKIITADQGQGLRCIYSGEPLIDQAFSLDHFLPWTFVCHDQIWNLCPVTPSSNSSKGNKLPADVYVEKFIQQQIHALEISSKIMSAKSWDKATESYAIDLHLDPELLLDESSVHDAYTGVLKPMIALAEQTGFESSWSYD